VIFWLVSFLSCWRLLSNLGHSSVHIEAWIGPLSCFDLGEKQKKNGF
jgi:hypothetical protein